MATTEYQIENKIREQIAKILEYWEMTRKMIKEYCDICGKEERTSKYKLPTYEKKSIKTANGDKMLECDVLISVEKDVCRDCASLIENFIKGYSGMRKGGISGFDINDGYGVHIICE